MELILLPLLIVGMYFLMIRPQQKRQQAVVAMQKALEPGTDVITIGGLHGRVAAIDDDTVDLEVTDDGVVLRFKRSAIADIIRPDADLDEDLDDLESDDEIDVTDDAAASASDD